MLTFTTTAALRRYTRTQWDRLRAAGGTEALARAAAGAGQPEDVDWEGLDVAELRALQAAILLGLGDASPRSAP